MTKTNLKLLIEEIESTAKDFKTSDTNEERGVYNFYINHIITEAPKTEQYNLCNYWEKLKR